MVSDQNSTLSSKDGINSASTTPAVGRFGVNYSHSPNAPSFSLPVSHVASSSHSYPTNQRGAGISDHAAVHGVTSRDHLDSIDEDDTVIVVMGHTGSGKSSFVNTAAGRTRVAVSHDLTSQTQAVQPVRCLHPDGRQNVVLVDTPGFNHTNRHDMQILMSIAHWLKETYRNNVKLTGILYLHRISDVRFAGTPLKNLAVFKDLCGDDNMKNIVLVTTMWDEVQDQSVGPDREGQLRSEFWKDMIGRGSRTCRFQGSCESAWEIIGCLELEESRQRRTPLQIQREMVEGGLPFHETTAAKTLLCFLVRLGGEFKRVWKKLRNQTN